MAVPLPIQLARPQLAKAWSPVPDHQATWHTISSSSIVYSDVLLTTVVALILRRVATILLLSFVPLRQRVQDLRCGSRYHLPP